MLGEQSKEARGGWTFVRADVADGDALKRLFAERRFDRVIHLAAQAGVDVDTTKIIVFGIAGAFYGLSALFLAVELDSAQAITGNNLLFPAVTAVAVGGVALTGGIGGAKKAALGALIVTALNDGLILLNVNPYAQEAVYTEPPTALREHSAEELSRAFVVVVLCYRLLHLG